MTSRERMDAAMHPGGNRAVDRVPVMCQLALGHYFLQAGLPPADIWHDSHAFADALLTLQERYRFDGILVNLPGRNPEWRNDIVSTERSGRTTRIHWSTGRYTVVPDDDLPRVYVEETDHPLFVEFASVDPERLFYVDPYLQQGLDYPSADEFPSWQWDTLKEVRRRAPDVSVHAEVFSPFSQFMELAG